jgi:lysophospholipase L1-like esterase
MNKRINAMLDAACRVLIRICAVLVLLCVVLGISAAAAGGCSGCAAESGRETDSGTDTSCADPSTDADGVTLPETADAGQAYQDRLTFVGDSLTAHLVSRGVLTDGQNTKQVWRTKNNMLNLDSPVTSTKINLPGTDRYVTIAEAAAELKPEILIITLGTDYGVSYLTESDFKAYYSKLVRAVQAASPDTAILLQSVFPVTAGCKVLSNEKIDRANVWVKAVAAENGCRYLDTQSVLKDDNNCLRDSYCNSEDGIHLTAEAYRVILSYIRTHAYTA